MSRASPELRNFAELLIAHESKSFRTADNKIPVAYRASEKLRPHLVTLLGNVGFRALFVRALALANADVSWLRAVQIKNDGSFDGFDDLEHRMEQHHFTHGCTVLLSHLLGLLVASIGEDLTLRLVGNVWPELSPNDLVFGKRDRTGGVT